MDWTGGVRKRFAVGKNNATIQKQKAHFAKARSALQNPPSSKGSFRPAFHGKVASRRSDHSSHRSAFVQPSDHPRSTRQSARSRTAHSPQNGNTQATGMRSQAQSAQDHSVIHITSSSVPSSAISESRHSGAATPVQRSSEAPGRDENATNDAERLLLANRRRLLARSDWLGLSAARPVHINFRSKHDQDRIGKRRKVAKSTSHKGKAATKRLITPLFEERLHPGDYLMSGALQPDDIHIKIGTDALASQTQQTRHSQTPRQGTDRYPPTELEPLSEESMLLGDEGDAFETVTQDRSQHQSRDMDTHRHHVSEFDETVNGRTPSQTYNHHSEPYVPHLQEAARMVAHPPMSAGGYDYPDIEPNAMVAHSEVDDHNGRDLVTAASTPNQLANGAEPGAESHGHVDDEAFWRRLMHFEQHTTSNPSMYAVKSSSLYVTATSDGSRRPVMPENSGLSSDPLFIPSTAKGAGTQASLLHGQKRDQLEASSTVDASPSASLEQIQKLAEQPARPVSRHFEEANEDAAWRDFIIGSQDSSDGSLRDGGKKQLPMREDIEFQSNTDMSMFDLSGMGTSVESTAGNTQRTIRQNVHSETRPKGVRAPRNMLQHFQPSAPTLPTRSDIGSDEIEDSQIEPPRPSKTPAPARSSILNPQRFKSAKHRRETISSSTRDTIAAKKGPSRVKTRPRVKEHSVYDLVDSDGGSLD